MNTLVSQGVHNSEVLLVLAFSMKTTKGGARASEYDLISYQIEKEMMDKNLATMKKALVTSKGEQNCEKTNKQT